MTVSSYNKPFLTVDEQLDRLSARGLVLGDRERAYQRLQAIGYYRLSGYWYPFRQPAARSGDPRPSEFVDGASLDEVLEIYDFDERLRASILQALSRIEVAIRFRVGHLLGQKGPFAHNDAAALDIAWTKSQTRECGSPNCSAACSWEASDHEQWMRKQKQNEDISSEAFIAHFVSNYGMPLPVWTATEVMSFGDLNRLYAGMTQRDRQQVAVEFDLFEEDGNGDARALSNWLEHLRQTRNYCAHAARLWNRNHTAPLSAPTRVSEMEHLRRAPVDPGGAREISRPASRIYGSLVLIAYLMARIDYSNEIRDDLRALVETFAVESPGRLVDMGFPQGWRDEEIWRGGYARDTTLASQAVMLRNVILLYTADAAAQLTKKTSLKERSSLLNYYRKNGALLSVPGTEAHRYPAFQFDKGSGDVPPVVIKANRRLLNGTLGTTQARWSALEWWTTANDAIPDRLSPHAAYEAGVLSAGLLDVLLKPLDDE